MKEKIRVIIKKTDERYGHEEEIPNTLAAIQEAVDGFAEVRYLGGGLAAIFDEEGLLKRSGWNMYIQGIPICGTIVFVGVVFVGEGTAEFKDCPLSLEEFRKKIDGGEL